MNDKYTILVRREGPHYVAVCLELNVTSRGATAEEAQRKVIEAIQEYLAFEHNEDSLAEQFDVWQDLWVAQTSNLDSRFSNN